MMYIIVVVELVVEYKNWNSSRSSSSSSRI